eukprot:11969303-Alexandrium_andersonii.AAC.1
MDTRMSIRMDAQMGAPRMDGRTDAYKDGCTSADGGYALAMVTHQRLDQIHVQTTHLAKVEQRPTFHMDEPRKAKDPCPGLGIGGNGDPQAS